MGRPRSPGRPWWIVLSAAWPPCALLPFLLLQLARFHSRHFPFPTFPIAFCILTFAQTTFGQRCIGIIGTCCFLRRNLFLCFQQNVQRMNPPWVLAWLALTVRLEPWWDSNLFGRSLQQWLKIQTAVQIPAEKCFDKRSIKASKIMHCLTNYPLSKDHQIAFSKKQGIQLECIELICSFKSLTTTIQNEEECFERCPRVSGMRNIALLEWGAEPEKSCQWAA